VKLSLGAVFRSAGRLDWPLLFLFLLINSIVLLNAVWHDPYVGYDAVGHLANVRMYARGQLPTRETSSEFFSPPLPYLFPAVVFRASNNLWLAAKLAQLLNVLLSLSLSLYLLKTASLIFDDDPRGKRMSLALIGSLPVYYKSFVFLRGEPFVACFTVLAIYQALKIVRDRVRPAVGILGMGTVLGLNILSRQWAFSLFPALLLFSLLGMYWNLLAARRVALVMLFSAIVAATVGGWYYVRLTQDYGTAMAFNRSPRTTSRPASVFTGLGDGKLFTDPIRLNFPGQVIPIFYSEIWGDYWAYFTVFAIDIDMPELDQSPESGRGHTFLYGPRLEKKLDHQHQGEPIPTNRRRIKRFLGRVNLISLPLTLLLAGGLLFGLLELGCSLTQRAASNAAVLKSLVTLTALCALLVYGWFLFRYAGVRGDTVKATYVLHVFPMLAILATDLVQKVTNHVPWMYNLVMILIGLTFLHNLPAMMTHYIWLVLL
jgi:hypothetical protein